MCGYVQQGDTPAAELLECLLGAQCVHVHLCIHIVHHQTLAYQAGLDFRSGQASHAAAIVAHEAGERTQVGHSHVLALVSIVLGGSYVFGYVVVMQFRQLLDGCLQVFGRSVVVETTKNGCLRYARGGFLGEQEQFGGRHAVEGIEVADILVGIAQVFYAQVIEHAGG